MFPLHGPILLAIDLFTASRWIQQLWNCDFRVRALHLQGLSIQCGPITKKKGLAAER